MFTQIQMYTLPTRITKAPLFRHKTKPDNKDKDPPCYFCSACAKRTIKNTQLFM